MNKIEKSSRKRMDRRAKGRVKSTAAYYFVVNEKTQERVQKANRALRKIMYAKDRKTRSYET